MELNKPYLVKRVADNSGVLHFLPHQGFCYGIEVNKPQLAKRVALKDGVLHFLMSDQKLDETTGKLIIGKPYFAKRVKQNADGTLHYVVSGKQCEEGDPPDVYPCPECEEPRRGQISVAISLDWDSSSVEVTCTGTSTYDGVMTWEERSYDAIESSPDACDPEGNPEHYAPCPEGCDGIVCGDYCYPRCEITRTGYWSEEITMQVGVCIGQDLTDPGNPVFFCGGILTETFVLVYYPSNCATGQWTLEKITLSRDYCEGGGEGPVYDGNPQPEPNLPPCYSVDCGGVTVGTAIEECEELINTTISYGGMEVTMIEDAA